MKLKKIKPIFLMLLLSTLCGACGQKGPLYRTPAPDANQVPSEQAPPQPNQGKEG